MEANMRKFVILVFLALLLQPVHAQSGYEGREPNQKYFTKDFPEVADMAVRVREESPNPLAEVMVWLLSAITSALIGPFVTRLFSRDHIG